MGRKAAGVMRIVENGEVPESWHRVTVQQLLDDGDLELVQDGNHGGNYPKADEFSDAGIPLITGANIEAGEIDLKECNFLKPAAAEKLRIAFAKPGDVLLTHKGTMGNTAIVPELATPYIILNPQLTLYRASNKGRLHSRFLKYFFDSSIFQSFLNRISGISTISTLSLTVQKSLELCFPDFSQQKAIARILGSLDDKIELNRRMNWTLESMARALFKSWFVDFDPVHANAAGNPTLFPAEFERSAIGDVPKGWEVGTLGDIVSFERETVKPAEAPDELFDHYSLPAFDDGRLPKIEAGGDIKSNKNAVSSDAVLMSKLNPRIPRVWAPKIDSRRRAICSTEFLVARPAQRVSRSCLYCVLTSDGFSNKYQAMATGTTGSHQRVSAKALPALPLAHPAANVVATFSKRVSPMLDAVSENITLSRTLAALRDTLLPRLLSGELSVAAAKEAVA